MAMMKKVTATPMKKKVTATPRANAPQTEKKMMRTATPRVTGGSATRTVSKPKNTNKLY